MNDTCVCGGSRERPNDDCERCQLIAEVDRLRAAREAAKAKVGEILAGALSGSEPRYRTDDGFVRWGLVEREILAAIDDTDIQL